MSSDEEKDKALLYLAEATTDYAEWSYVESLSTKCISEKYKSKIKQIALFLYLKEEASVNNI